MCFKDRVRFGLCHFLVIVYVIFSSVPVPGDNIAPPLYKSTKSCESLLLAEWQQIIFFLRSKIFSDLIWYKLTSCDVES